MTNIDKFKCFLADNWGTIIGSVAGSIVGIILLNRNKD